MDDRQAPHMGIVTLLGFFALAIIVVAVFFAIPAFWRYQAIQNANNQVTINSIEIQQQAQRIQVVKQQAEQRVEEAKGIAEAQRIINSSLTASYLQHEAIGAQLEAARNSSHTETLYIPSGVQGIPLVLPATTSKSVENR